MQQIVRHYGIRTVTFDRWNSAHSIQALVAMGVDAQDMSFSNAEQMAMYKFLRLLFYNNMIELPYDEALQNELKFLREKNGKIEHDLYGKDRADAVAAAVWNASGRRFSNIKRLVQATLRGTGAAIRLAEAAAGAIGAEGLGRPLART
jgi:hypothetical protein